MSDQKNIPSFVENRQLGVRGRRKFPNSDEDTCVFHELMFEKNEEAFDLLRSAAKAETTRLDRKFDHLEAKIEKLVTKWALGIILSMFMSVLGGVFALGVWQLEHIDQKLTILSSGMTELITTVSVVVTRQMGVLDELEKLAPEHRVLMNHMNKAERERELKQELKQIYDYGGESR